MVQQIPDFELSQTSGDRGLGQASQNVLINGNRVSGKANDAETALGQISASSVERIEISDGARLGIAGLTGRIANVIVRGAPLRIQYRWEFQNRRNIPDQIATGSVSASGRLGATDFTLSLSNAEGIRRGGVGLERVTDANNVLLVTRNQRDVFENDEPRLGATISRDWGGGRVLNLNASFTVERYRNFSDAVATTVASGLVRDENFVSRSDDWNSELGGDYSFPVGTNGSLKIIVLQYLEHSDFDSTFLITDRAPGVSRRGSRFERASDEGESVLRAEYDWGPDTGRWQFAVETAYNFLDTSSLTGALTPGGGFALAPLPGGASFVDEWRTEALLTRNWLLAPGMTLRTTAGAEASRISQTGAGGLTRRFVRPKGAIALAWTASPRATVNASIERRVGQLSFFDFTSGINLLDGFATGSNTRLVPEQAWRARVELVRSFGSAGSITVGATYDWISDIVDSIPLSATEEGIGNLPSARRWTLGARGSLILDQFGWQGARINFSSVFTNTRVRDPLTGAPRPISGEPIRNWSAEFRHDIPSTQWAWGMYVSEDLNGDNFRLDQISASRLTLPVSGAFIEHKNVLGMTVRAGIRNFLLTKDDIRREVYVDRRNGPVAFREAFIRNIYPIFTVTVSGSF